MCKPTKRPEKKGEREREEDDADRAVDTILVGRRFDWRSF